MGCVQMRTTIGAVSSTQEKRVSSYVETHVGGLLEIGNGAVSPTRVECVSSRVEIHLGGCCRSGPGLVGERAYDGKKGMYRICMRRTFPEQVGNQGSKNDKS